MTKLPALLGVCGRIGSGKDTFAEILVHHFGYKHIAFSDPLYTELRILNPWIQIDRKMLALMTEEERGELYRHAHALLIRYKTLLHLFGLDRTKRISSEVRRYFQLLGTECGRDVHGQDCWLKVAERTMSDDPGRYVITGLRFDNEMTFTKKKNGQIWLIKSIREIPPDPNHVSESIKDYTPYADVIIRNDGTKEEFVDQIVTLFNASYPERD